MHVGVDVMIGRKWYRRASAIVRRSHRVDDAFVDFEQTGRKKKSLESAAAAAPRVGLSGVSLFPKADRARASLISHSQKHTHTERPVISLVTQDHTHVALRVTDALY